MSRRIDGFCWQHDTTAVEAKEFDCGFLQTTAYSDALLDDMDELVGGWPERVLTMQRNWIGKSRGTRIRFAVEGPGDLHIEVFTTRVDTIFGASAVVLSAGHPLLAFSAGRSSGSAAWKRRLRGDGAENLRAADLATAPG